MSKYYKIKTYTKHKKRNFRILYISNKIIIKKMRKNDCLNIL